MKNYLRSATLCIILLLGVCGAAYAAENSGNSLAALVAPADVPATAVNVILALCGSTLATYFASVKLRGKISAADIANATLAGGVAIGSTCDLAVPASAFAIGILAGVISTFGFAVIQAKLTDMSKKVDTCGVLYLHGLPGLFGGIAALFIVSGIDVGAQLAGILVTVALAASTGLLSGKVIASLGRRSVPYADAEEFEGEEEEAVLAGSFLIVAESLDTE